MFFIVNSLNYNLFLKGRIHLELSISQKVFLWMKKKTLFQSNGWQWLDLTFVSEPDILSGIWNICIHLSLHEEGLWALFSSCHWAYHNSSSYCDIKWGLIRPIRAVWSKYPPPSQHHYVIHHSRSIDTWHLLSLKSMCTSHKQMLCWAGWVPGAWWGRPYCWQAALCYNFLVPFHTRSEVHQQSWILGNSKKYFYSGEL